MTPHAMCHIRLTGIRGMLALAAFLSPFVASPFASAQEAAALKAFTGARIIDGSGQVPLENGVLLVRDGRIEAVGAAATVTIPEGAERIDLAGMTVMPGLVNAHGHAAGGTAEKLALFARYGVTTVVSLGGEDASHVVLRDAQRHAGLERARIFVAGPVQEPQTAEAAVRGVTEIKALGADWLKARQQGSGMPEAAYTALMREAHDQGLKVAVHIYTLEDAMAMLRNDADMLAHSVRDVPVDADLVALMQQNNTCITPTLTREVSTYVYESTPDFFSDPFFVQEADAAVVADLEDPAAQRRMAANAQQGKDDLAMAQRNLKTLYDAGVRIALGTDSGASPSRFAGYFEHLEMELMAEAGMAPMDIIVASTSQAAECMGLAAELGTLAAGKWADFVVMEANPLEAITNTKTLQSVWIAGNQVPD